MQNNHSLDRSNRRVSNLYSSRGSPEDISSFLFDNGLPLSFVISGGVSPDERLRAVAPVLDQFAGRMPIILLHAGDSYMEALVHDAWQNADGAGSVPCWLCGEKSPHFEPFFRMTESQIVTCCRLLAIKLSYSVTPRFERVVRAHLGILTELNIPFSLSGLYYLCQFRDMGELHANVMALPCGESRARGLWADLGADADNDTSFDLFRAVIQNLARDAETSGWRADNNIREANCLSAVAKNAIFSLPVNALYSSLILPYLFSELTILGDRPFLLLIDNVKITDSDFLAFLSTPTGQTGLGLLADNIVDRIGTEDADFWRLAERIHCFVLFKHGTARTASALSEVLGKFDYTKAEQSRGISHGFGRVMPRDRHRDVRLTTENRYRVMPEEFTALGPGQAIIFDTKSDRIIRYN